MSEAANLEHKRLGDDSGTEQPSCDEERWKTFRNRGRGDYVRLARELLKDCQAFVVVVARRESLVVTLRYEEETFDLFADTRKALESKLDKWDKKHERSNTSHNEAHEEEKKIYELVENLAKWNHRAAGLGSDSMQDSEGRAFKHAVEVIARAHTVKEATTDKKALISLLQKLAKSAESSREDLSAIEVATKELKKKVDELK